MQLNPISGQPARHERVGLLLPPHDEFQHVAHAVVADVFRRSMIGIIVSDDQRASRYTQFELRPLCLILVDEVLGAGLNRCRAPRIVDSLRLI